MKTGGVEEETLDTANRRQALRSTDVSCDRNGARCDDDDWRALVWLQEGAKK